jgi:Dolichyl-phosphate-mannose-protein mannosyltransferase
MTPPLPIPEKFSGVRERTDENDIASSSGGAKWALILFAIVAVRLCVMPLIASLAVDETGTWWIVKGSLAQTISRASYWAGQSVFFMPIAWSAKQIGGAHEIVLRLPSLLAMGVAVFFLYRLAERLLDRTVAPIAILLFLCIQSVAYSAADARPNALGLASSIAAMSFLIRWLDSGRLTDGAAYAVSASLMLYFHFLFGAVFVVHAGYLTWKLLRSGCPPWRQLVAVLGLGALLLAPLASRFLHTFQQRGTFNHAGTPHISDLLRALAPPAAALGLLTGLLAASLCFRTFRLRPPALARDTLVLLASWAVVPIVVLFAISVLTPDKVFLGRYLLPAYPGSALLGAWVIRGIAPQPARSLVLFVIAGFSLGADGGLTHLWPKHGPQDWRGSMAAVRSITGDTQVPVLFQSPFIESMDERQLFDPGHRELLLAPISFYPCGGNVIPFPNKVNDRTLQYLSQVTSATLEPSGRFVLVASEGEDGLREWLARRLEPRGFTVQPRGEFGEISVTLFEKRK